jgi:hypothetical protein
MAITTKFEAVIAQNLDGYLKKKKNGLLKWPIYSITKKIKMQKIISRL